MITPLKDRLCKNCLYWQWNGATAFNPRIGYCMANKWAYRKETQSCKSLFKPKSKPNTLV